MARTIRYTGGILPELSVEQTEAAARGDLAIYWLNQRLELRLRPDEREEFERAKERGYVITKGRRCHLRNCWFHWCEAKDHPWVTVQLGSKYAKVEVDLIGQSWKLTDESVKAIFDWAKDELWRTGGSAKKGASVSGGRTCTVIQGVANDLAEAAAARLLGAALESKPDDCKEVA
ncbi:MAG: hypothetical protein M1358_00875 [Chloroflexi bacterium]|nr:hypothetical protein [Chloroflexota bacterium]